MILSKFTLNITRFESNYDDFDFLKRKTFNAT